MFKLLCDLNDPRAATLLVRENAKRFIILTLFQRVRAAPMPKPDKVLRFRPLREIPAALKQLKHVVLFHPKPIVEHEDPIYCVCRKGERQQEEKERRMVMCDGCEEWFHIDCVGLKSDSEVKNKDWKCFWCQDVPDKEGFQRWRYNRKMPKKRLVQDTPKVRKARNNGVDPDCFTNPPTWEGKVAQVKELSRKAAVKKRKLTAAVEGLVKEGGHHLVDAQGLGGLEQRPVDECMIDEMIEEELVDEQDEEEEE